MKHCDKALSQHPNGGYITHDKYINVDTYMGNVGLPL